VLKAQNVVPVHAHTPSVAVSTGWQPSQWQSAADHPTLQRGTALAGRYLYDIYYMYILNVAGLPGSCRPSHCRRGSDLNCFGGQRSGPMKSGVSCCSSWMVSRARCAGAMSCWNTNVSPATRLIAGSICWDSKTSRSYWQFTFTPGSANISSVIVALIRSAIWDKICHF